MADASVETKAAAFAAEANASVSDFIALLKPRVMSLAVFTALTGLVAAPGHIHSVLAVIAILCIAAGAGACGSLNMWYDADIDAKMARTAGRPIPRGRITGEEAFAFGIVLAIISVMTLGLIVNWTAGALLALTIAFYVLVYTMWLKRRTPQNIVIGGAAGALPPMIGWASVTGSISADSALLFLIIFLWTPPHFWALALYRCRDYQRAQVPMLPVTAGPDATRRQILLYSLLLAPIGVAPALTGLGGAVYLAASVMLGFAFLALATDVFIRREGLPANRAAQRLFSFSILYLFLLFAVLLAEHAGRFWLP